MQTSLVTGRHRSLGLQFRERYDAEQNVSLTADGIVDADKCDLEGRVTLFKRFNVVQNPLDQVVDVVDLGGSYCSDGNDLRATVRARKSWSFGQKGRTGCLKIGGEADFNKDRQADARGRIELTTKLANINKDQDVKLKLGYGHKRIGVSNNFLEGPYGCIHENNWSVMTNFNDFVEVKYDL